MPQPNKSDYLNRTETITWGRFLKSPEGQKGLLYLKLSCPKVYGKDDPTLIKNAVGFEYWQSCVDAMENLGELPPKNEYEPVDTLEPV